jgi:hypothetical protein
MRLGDHLENLISIITLGQGKKIATYIAKLRGKEDCGCDRKKDYLNNLKFNNVELKIIPITLDWSTKWREIREQVNCSCQFDYALLTVKDKSNNLLHEEKLLAIPYMNGQIQKKIIHLHSLFPPQSFTLMFHKKEENEFINPINVEM